jgi:hypothetical protein
MLERFLLPASVKPLWSVSDYFAALFWVIAGGRRRVAQPRRKMLQPSASRLDP